jgi:hypothetical protein
MDAVEKPASAVGAWRGMLRAMRRARSGWRAMVAMGLVAAGCGRSPFDVLGRAHLDDHELDHDVDPVAGGCRKVDYLFVIDNSASMLPYQRALVSSFGVFIEGVERTQQSLESVHVGVVTTDRYSGNTDNPDPTCLDLGGLVTKTHGHNSSNSQCGPYAEGHSYMTELDDLDETFPCAAQVGTTGSTVELPLAALTSAVIDLDRPGACNDGFVRDDALLVVVIVTDEDDPDPVERRYERLVAAKGGHADNIVVVGLVNEPGTACPLSGHSTEATMITSFVGMFTHGFVAPVCGDYDAAFMQAVAVVEAACTDA